MIDQVASLWILGSLLGTFVLGLVLLRWGHRLPRRGDWLVGIALVAVLAAVLLNQVGPGEASTASMDIRGWIWPREEAGAIRVGVLRDLLATLITGVAAVLCGLATLHRGMVLREERHERLYSASALTIAGVALSWHSLTPWLAFAGLMISVFGGFVALGLRWSSDSEAAIAARFLRDRSIGWVLSLLGAAALTSSGEPMIAGIAHVAAGANSGQWLGAILLTAGIAVQLQPFPFLGWVGMKSSSVPAAKVLFGQLLPGLAAFAVLVRFEPQLRAIGVLPLLGWGMIGSALITSISGLLQKHWQEALGFWISAAFSFAVAALSFSGPWAAVAILVGSTLAASSLVLLGSAGCDPKLSIWSKTAQVLAACCGSGLVGFVTCAGTLRTLQDANPDPTLLAFLAFASFLLILLVWKLAWMMPSSREPRGGHGASVAIPFVGLLLSLGILWTGTLTGGALPGDADTFTSSLLNLALGKGMVHSDDTAFLTASWIHWGTWLAAVTIAYLTQARGEDRWQRLFVSFPRIATFISGGYGVDAVMARVMDGLSAIGSALYRAIDEKTWGIWIPDGLSWLMHRSSFLLNQSNTGLTRLVNRGIHRATDVPAKVLQLVQSGDIQWYLFFAIGSGIAMLIHFLRF